MAKTLTNAQREALNKNKVTEIEKAQLLQLIPHQFQFLMRKVLLENDLILASEQALLKENERLLAFCKLLASEEEMFQEGKYETEMSKLQASEQAWREEAEQLLKKIQLYHGSQKTLTRNVVELEQQLNQAVEVLKWYADEEKYTLYSKQWIVKDRGRRAKNILYLLSQKVPLKDGDRVVTLETGKEWTLTNIQYEYNRYKLNDLSNWHYGIDNLQLANDYWLSQGMEEKV